MAALIAAVSFFACPPSAIAADQATLEACVEGTGIAERDYQLCTRAIADCGKEGVELATLHVARGLALAAVGAHDKATLDFDRGLVLNPASAAALHARGLSHQARGRWAASIADFDSAILLFPQYFNSFRHRGTTRLLSGDFEAALVDFDHAIRLDAAKPSVFMFRGIARYLVGPEVWAIADFERAAAMRFPQTHLDVWRLLARRGLAEAVRAGLPEIRLEVDADAPPWLAALTRRIADGGEAAAVWATIEAVAPKRRPKAVEVVGFYLALDARARGDEGAARAHLARATEAAGHRSIEGALARVVAARER